MFLIRGAAYRAISSPITSISFRSRSITTLRSSAFTSNRSALLLPFQRRFASEEVTQAEPEADGATEAQHGENSIAGSSQETNSYNNQDAPTSADQGNHSSVASAMSSVAETVSTKASEVAQTTIRGLGGKEASSNQLYLGNLSFTVTLDAIRRELERFGPLEDCRLVFDPRGLSRGFGYVTFINASDAKKAMEELNQQVFEGRRMTLQYALSKDRVSRQRLGPNTPTKTLFIGNLSFDMTDNDLNDLFRNIRDVVDVRVAIDRRTGQPRGFAHADFLDVESAEKAFKVLDQKEVCGRNLRVDFSNSAAGNNMTSPRREDDVKSNE